jgi:tetratricopeptide (TPR) repeat protein
MSEKELPPDERNIYLKALAALELRNYGLVVALLGPLVTKRPEFLEGRKRLREAQIARSKGKSSFLGLSGSGMSLGRSKVGKLIDAGDFPAALAEAEKALDADPSGVQSNKDLFAAAEAAADSGRKIIGEIHKQLGGNEKLEGALWKKLNFIRSHNAAAADPGMLQTVQAAEQKTKTFEAIARFALQTTIDLDPKNLKARHELGDYLMRIEEYDDATTFFEKLGPKDLDARDKAKQAAALRSMRGKGKTFQEDVEKRRQEAQESGDKVVGAEESVEELAQKVYEAHEAGSPDRESARKLADIYFNREDYNNALEYYRYLSALANDTDPGLLRKISDTEVRNLSRAIADKDKELESLAPDSEQAATLRAEIDELRRGKAEQMLGEARKRVERNPTDLQYRFELGEQLVLAGHYKDAIPELQKARSNPNTRTKALNLLGRCYTERNMLDLAAKTLTDAASEIPGMDGTKKDILYNLGLVYERMGNIEKSLDCMKQIYEVDYGYRDVAARVEASYTA